MEEGETNIPFVSNRGLSNLKIYFGSQLAEKRLSKES